MGGREGAFFSGWFDDSWCSMDNHSGFSKGFFFRVGGAKRCTERDSGMLWGEGRGEGRPVPIRLLL